MDLSAAQSRKHSEPAAVMIWVKARSPGERWWGLCALRSNLLSLEPRYCIIALGCENFSGCWQAVSSGLPLGYPYNTAFCRDRKIWSLLVS